MTRDEEAIEKAALEGFAWKVALICEDADDLGLDGTYHHDQAAHQLLARAYGWTDR